MNTIFVAPVGGRVGLSSVALGLVRALQRTNLRLAFAKPVGQNHVTQGSETNHTDSSVHFARQACKLEVPEPVTLDRAEALLGQQEEATLLEEIIGVVSRAQAGTPDMIVLEGLTLSHQRAYAHNLNISMARNLDAHTVLVVSLEGQSNNDPKKLEDLTDQLEIAVRDFAGSNQDRVVGLVFNFAAEGLETLLKNVLASRPALKNLPVLGVIVNNPGLQAPRTADVARLLGAQILNAGQINSRRVLVNMVTARSVQHIVGLLQPGTLVVTPGDREDVIMAVSLASLGGVPLAGLLLTSGFMPQASIWRLCKPALRSDLPVLLVESNSYMTATKLGELDAQVPLDDLERIEQVLDQIADQLNVQSLQHTELGEHLLSPPAFRYELIQRARAAQRRIVLPEGDEPRTVRAATICHQKGIAHCVLLAKPESVRSVAEAQGLQLPADLEIVDPDLVRHRYIGPMVELRKHKGLTAPMAEQMLEDTVVLGTMMLAQNEVDGLVSGAVHTTANTVRPALQLIKTAPGVKIVSSVFFMLMPEQVLVYGDCAINPDPNPEELADIALQSADSAQAFGITPRVAMLSYSTGVSGEGADVEKVAAATKIARERRPSLEIDGPLQYDAASVESVGKQKAPGSRVAGRATVFIFPDLNTGNTTYKAVQRSANVISVGPMLQGLRKPVNDLSRGALVDDIVFTIALTAIQASSSN